MKKKEIIIVLGCIILSFVCGYLSHDVLIGSLTLLTAILSAYYSSEGKNINYIFGIINCLFIAYAGFQNHLYGLFAFYICIYVPFQMYGYHLWNLNNKKDNVIVRSFDNKTSIIVILSCITGSLLIAFLLSLIPTQRLAFLDALSNVLNISAFILMMLRYKECWWVWLANNTVDLVIWTINLINHGADSTMMLLVSISYFLINIYGIYRWQKRSKQNKLNK